MGLNPKHACQQESVAKRLLNSQRCPAGVMEMPQRVLGGGLEVSGGVPEVSQWCLGSVVCPRGVPEASWRPKHQHAQRTNNQQSTPPSTMDTYLRTPTTLKISPACFKTATPTFPHQFHMTKNTKHYELCTHCCKPKSKPKPKPKPTMEQS